MTPDPTSIDRWVNRWVGTPHVYDGRSLDGVDCYGLVWRFYLDLYGIELPDWSRAGMYGTELARLIAKEKPNHWEPLAHSVDPCVALCHRARLPHHMGINWRGRIIHSIERGGVRADDINHFALHIGRPEYGTIRELSHA
jgi:cell wall-associated NlpC family hydrolase